MASRKEYVVIQKDCVACGSCMKVCPKDAIQVIKGIYAQIDKTKCIRCGLCMKACPASVIFQQEADNE